MNLRIVTKETTMNIWIVLVFLGLIVQALGIFGYLSSTEVLVTEHTSETVERVVDRESGKVISSRRNGKGIDWVEWKLVPRTSSPPKQ